MKLTELAFLGGWAGIWGGRGGNATSLVGLGAATALVAADAACWASLSAGVCNWNGTTSTLALCCTMMYC